MGRPADRPAAARGVVRRPSTPSSPTPSPSTTPPGTPNARPARRSRLWDVTLHTPAASEYAATSELHITGDTLFLTDLYRSLSRDAVAAGKAGDDQPLGVRKVNALATLFTGGRAATLPGGRAASEASDQSRPPPQTVLYLHLDLTDLDDDGLVEDRQRRAPRPGHHRQDPRVARQLTVRIQPVIRMNGDDAVNGHDPPDRIRDQVILRDPTCRFPGCQVDSRRCDLDHVIPYDPSGPPGQTRPSNLVPLCTTPPQRQDHRSLAVCPHARRRLPVDRSLRQSGGRSRARACLTRSPTSQTSPTRPDRRPGLAFRQRCVGTMGDGPLE